MNNSWLPILAIGGVAVAGIVVYFLMNKEQEQEEEPIEVTPTPSPILIEPSDPQYIALVEYYRQQSIAPFNIYKQILPQSDVLRYDPSYKVWRYRYGTWPGYDPAPYQAYSLPPNWGTDPYYLDPFWQRFSDFDI